jgi:hypothetical protein
LSDEFAVNFQSSSRQVRETIEETTMTQTTITELAQRRNDGLEVTLLWARDDDTVHVAVLNERTGRTATFPVDRAKALDAFYHPFAYAA